MKRTGTGRRRLSPRSAERKKLWNIPFQSKAMSAGAMIPRYTIFFHPDYTVGPGVSPGHALRLAGCTAGGESHPALKILIQLRTVYYLPAPMSTIL